MKYIIFIALALMSVTGLSGQKYMTQSGNISFFSKAPLENIEAINNQVSSVINLEDGNMAFSLLMKAFKFEKALMQEHFNEKYIHSDKFPKATFTGLIQDFDSLNLSDKWSDVRVKGELTMHGQSKPRETVAKLRMTDAGLEGSCVFKFKLSDYDIKIPGAVRENIAKEIEITVDVAYEKL